MFFVRMHSKCGVVSDIVTNKTSEIPPSETVMQGIIKQYKLFN